MEPIKLYSDPHGVGLRGFVPTVILANGQVLDARYEIAWNATAFEGDSTCAQAEVVNTGDLPLHVEGFRWRFDPAISDGPALTFPPALRPHVFATENLRGDYFGTGTVEGDRFFYPLTNQEVTYGNTEDNAFPGVFIFAADAPIGLLIAQASQDRFHALYRFRGRMERRNNWLFEVEERLGGVGAITLAPGKRLRGEKLFFHLAGTNDPQQATVSYYRLLRDAGAFDRHADNPLPSQRIYCSWNYDFFQNIDQDKLLEQLPILKKYLPQVGFVQIDDGYQSCHAPGQRAMIDLCYGDLPNPFDSSRFPDGPRALADRIKAAGLRPAIWLALWASTGSQMLKDHPDWILRDDTGAALLFEKWYGGCAVIDPSIQGVQDYLHRLCRTVFDEWGFEGVKLDFSSFAFNAKRVRYRSPGRSAVELRHEVETIFRRYLPGDGFFGWCVVAGTGQPFLSKADYFRNAVDISRGDWATVKRVATWTANTNMLLQERPCLANIDSIGWSEEFNDITWQTWLNLAAISGAAMEVSGDLRKLEPARLARLARTLELSVPSRRVRCLGLPLGKLAQPPAIWLAEGNDDCRLLAVFNWIDEPAVVSIDLPELASMRGDFRDPWSGEILYEGRLPRTIELRGRESIMLQNSSRD